MMSDSPTLSPATTTTRPKKKRAHNTYVSSESPGSVLDGDSLSLKRGRKENEQHRRVMMNQYFDELVILLSMISERKIPKKMDKVSTLHEAVRCMRTYSDLTTMTKTQPKMKGKGGSKVAKEVKLEGLRPGLISSGEVLQFFLDAHDTFLFLVSESGYILYATELITSLLGHMQTRLVGQNIFDYIPQSEKSILLEMFNPSDDAKPKNLHPDGKVVSYPSRSFKCHFRIYTGETCSLTQHLPFVCLSYLRRWKESLSPGSPLSPTEVGEVEPLPLPDTASRHQSCILLLGKLPTNLTLFDLPVGVNDVNFTFDMRVSKEGNIISIDSHAVLILGYTVSEIIGSRFFDYIDPYHLTEVGEHMADFFNNGRGTTNPYRLFTKGGRYIWLLSKGYISYNPWNHKPDHFLLSNRVLGCDHVLPEFRFFRSRVFLPNQEGEELYNPPPLRQDVTEKSPPKHAQMHEKQNESVQQPMLMEHQQQHHQQHQHQQHQHEQHQQHQQQELWWNVSSDEMEKDAHSTITSGMAMVPGQDDAFPPELPLSISRSSSLSTLLQSPHVPHTLGHMKSEASGGNQCGGRGNSSDGARQTPGQSAEVGNYEGGQSIKAMEFRKEMEKKNQELFEMQRRLLEQQMLMEQERNQFYQVAQQVLHCIGSTGASPAASSLLSNLQVPFFASQTSQTNELQKQSSQSSLSRLPQLPSFPSPATPNKTPHLPQLPSFPSPATPNKPPLPQLPTFPSSATPNKPHLPQLPSFPSPATPNKPPLPQLPSFPSSATPNQPHLPQLPSFPTPNKPPLHMPLSSSAGSFAQGVENGPYAMLLQGRSSTGQNAAATLMQSHTPNADNTPSSHANSYAMLLQGHPSTGQNAAATLMQSHTPNTDNTPSSHANPYAMLLQGHPSTGQNAAATLMQSHTPNTDNTPSSHANSYAMLLQGHSQNPAATLMQSHTPNTDNTPSSHANPYAMLLQGHSSTGQNTAATLMQSHTPNADNTPSSHANSYAMLLQGHPSTGQNPAATLMQSHTPNTDNTPSSHANPYAMLLQGHSQNPATTLMQSRTPNADNTPSSRTTTWTSVMQKPNRSQPEQAKQMFQQQVQQKLAEQHRQLQQLQNSQLGGFTPPSTAASLQLPPGGLNLPQTPQLGGENFPQPPMLPSQTPTTLTSFTSAYPNPALHQSQSSPMRMPSFPSNPSSLQGLLSSTAQTPNSSQQQSDLSTGLPMRLPNDEEIQSLLDAIQMKCSSMSPTLPTFPS